MTKKAYRPRSSRTPIQPRAAAPGAPATVETTRDAAPVPAIGPKKQVDFAREYHYVLGDLRKMAIIAVAMFAVLIVLSFAIR